MKQSNADQWLNCIALKDYDFQQGKLITRSFVQILCYIPSGPWRGEGNLNRLMMGVCHFDV